MSVDAADPSSVPAIRVDRRTVDRLAARGVISAAARDHALDLIGPPRRWGVWTARLLVVIGTALLLAGIVDFFAFNWNRIPPLAKLGGIAGLIAAASLTVAIVGFGRLVSDAASSAAVVLVGVYLAVEGQIHQTGADAWQLFAGWAGLTLAWALLACSSATWAIWIVVADVALVTWWSQTQPGDGVHHAGRDLSIVALHGVALALREVLAARGVAWVRPRWTRIVVALPAIGAATLSALFLIVEIGGWGTAARLAAAAVPATFVLLFFVYRGLLPDVAVLSATTLAVAVIADFALFRLAVGDGVRSDVGLFFLMGLATLAIFAAAVAWLRAASRRMEERP